MADQHELIHGKRGDVTTLRSAIASNDSEPVLAQTAFNPKDYRYICIEAKLVGTATSACDLTPLYWNDTASAYFKGEKRNLSGTVSGTAQVNEKQAFIIPSLNVADFFLMVDGLVGTNPNITLYASGLNY